jgi:hypothetical protein
MPRRVSALACAVSLTFVVACAANASVLEPDPSAGSAPTSLQPDSFPAPATAKPAPAPRTSVAAPATVGHSLTEVPVTPPPVSAAKVATPAPAPRIHVEPTAPATVPVPVGTTPPVTTPAATTPAAKASPTRPRAPARVAQVRPKLPVVVGLELPERVTGTLTMPRLTRAVPTAAAAASRDLLPAALGVLALVATSGCLLAVAVRARRAELEG